MEGIALPEVVGVGFGEGETSFGAGVIGRLEQIKAVDGTPEGVRRDL